MVAVSFRNVSKVFESKAGAITALDDVNAEVPAGSIFGVVGTSGAGKSTLLRTVNGLESPSSGTVQVLGKEVTALGGADLRALRRDVSMVFQHYNLLNSQSVAHNVGLPLILAGTPRAQVKKRVAEVLAMVGLESRAENTPKQLSGGQRQRVAIARSMARQPKILIADEPTGNLDPETSWGIVHLLEEINNFGTTILVTTHDEKIVNQLRRRVITLSHGKIIGDQKEGGHYNLDAASIQLNKRPLASVQSERPSVEQIRRATTETSKPHIIKTATNIPQAERIAEDMNRFHVDVHAAEYAKRTVDADSARKRAVTKARRKLVQ